MFENVDTTDYNTALNQVAFEVAFMKAGLDYQQILAEQIPSAIDEAVLGLEMLYGIKFEQVIEDLNAALMVIDMEEFITVKQLRKENKLH